MNEADRIARQRAEAARRHAQEQDARDMDAKALADDALRTEIAQFAKSLLATLNSRGYEGIETLRVEKKTMFGGWKKVEVGAYRVGTFEGPVKDYTATFTVHVMSDGRISLAGGQSAPGGRDLATDGFLAQYLRPVRDALRIRVGAL